ncbi:hypothetical protein PFICI_06133 [Pestalotiopsis fici W106-1]|uniref:Rhodopsin domain-containing protein n=1 Tax=Pestalotiopsis fici (strain W106-1 / CGMCC3.15140) TaxID=1229662 RepID=W3X7I4_PESFW|nr:uncharacterized protein PFICI_06133 [Pestalotiopsis fici W106-1]ETS81131.1 hypothetical protein PFICI_06133 [Pestalotiopsis fici W106-1]
MADAIENRGPQLAVVDYTFAILAFVTILLRCGVRLFIVRSFGLDDWLMSLAAVTFMLYCSFSLTGVSYGTGRHEADLPATNVSHGRMFWWLCYLMYCTTMILSKISIGYLLLRVAVKKIHAWIIYGAMVITGITCTIFFFVVIFQCSPVSFFWNKHQDNGTCINIEVIIGLAYLYSACSVITDFTFALLPAWIIMGLQLHRRTKFALIPLMAMGCVASAAVVVRFAYLPRFRDPDFLWATLDIAIWSTVEQGLAIAAGSLATLRPLLRLLGWKLGLTTRPSHMHSSYGKMGGSRSAHLSGHMSSRRRGSQGAADVLTMNSLKEGTRPAKSSSGNNGPTSYEVRCEARNARSRNDLESLSNVITHGKTYEVSSEYISPASPDDVKIWIKPSPTGSRDVTWPEKERSHSTESTERLRTKRSSDSIFGLSTSPV